MIFFAWTKIKQSFYQIETRQFRGAAQNTLSCGNIQIAACAIIRKMKISPPMASSLERGEILYIKWTAKAVRESTASHMNSVFLEQSLAKNDVRFPDRDLRILGALLSCQFFWNHNEKRFSMTWLEIGSNNWYKDCRTANNIHRDASFLLQSVGYHQRTPIPD